MPELNTEQSAALDAIHEWVTHGTSFFILSGSAGTGKTFTVDTFRQQFTKGRVMFTAPTNKATKVLRETLTRPDYKPECRTIYSALGLKLEPNGEVKELTAPDDPVDLADYVLVVVDEASMLNQQVLGFMVQAAEMSGVRFLLLGDPAQLPPVKEITSPVWTMPAPAAKLTTVMRHDNAILTLATALRDQVDRPVPRIDLPKFANPTGGVYLTGQAFPAQIEKAIASGALSRRDGAKVIAWRNLTVDGYNLFVRKTLFGLGAPVWLETDRVLFTSPARDLDDKPMASTDDEGEIQSVTEVEHPLYREFMTFRISIILDDNRPVIAYTLHPDSALAHAARVDELLRRARADKSRWGAFWDFKEAFHTLRHAYAITSHRAQGSTYDTALVDWRDILLNPNRQEAYRCLYVACTRPKRLLVLN